MQMLDKENERAQIKTARIVWIVLMIATSIGAILGSLETTGIAVVFFSIIILIIKGQLIIDFFMGIRHVERHWRILMTAYCIVIGSFVLLAYILSVL